MKAVVMAGGAGSRLRPITIERPKPMVSVVNKPALGHILDLLKRYGITEVIITVQYLANMIQDYFGTGANLGMKITYCVEEDPMGTAGSVKNVHALLDDTFMVLSGDAITSFDLESILNYHKEKQSKVTITLHRVNNPLEFGVIITNSEGRITQFLEKPSWGEVISDTVNTGLYVLEPEILDFIPEDQPYDFSTQLFPQLLRHQVAMYGYIADGYWCDIGNIGTLRDACDDILQGRVPGVDLGTQIDEKIWVGKDVEISPSASLFGPVYLGDSVRIKDGVVIHGPTVIRDYSIIDERTQIDRSIIWRNCYIGKGAELRGAVVLKHCSIKAKSVVHEGAVIGDGSIVGEGAVIHPDVKVWSGKEIEPGATIKHSVIWGSQGRRSLFGRQGVSGMINVDFTPEFSAKLAAAFGATLPRNSLVTINRDPHRGPRMLKRAAISGMPSAGIQVADIGVQPIPVARYYTRVTPAVACLHVRLSPFNQMVANMSFIDADGLNLNKDRQRQIERVFFREDFRRVYMEEIGSINYAPRVVETYTQGFLKAINATAIQAAKFNLVIDYASGPTALVLPPLLTTLKCNVVALNANVDETKMSISYEDFEDALYRLRVISASLSANLGVRIDVGGETLSVVDDHGRSIDGTDLGATMAELVLTANPGKAIAISINQPHIFEKIAARHGSRVIRTRVDAHSLMLASLQDDVAMATDGRGSFIFPNFQPVVDGLIAVAKLLEFLALQSRKLSDIIAELPNYHIAQAKTYCLWEAKGTVMRELNQRFESRLTETVEGLKIVFGEDEWILVLPSQDQPYIEVIAEAQSQLRADELVEEYAQLIRQLQPRTG